MEELEGGGRAAGVRVAGIDGSEGEGTVLRGRETLLCAGAVHSPAILMRSGIGPGEVLEAAGVGCVVELAGVGGNLRDHPTVGLHLKLRPAARAGGPHARRDELLCPVQLGAGGCGAQ